jgi:Zn-dependent peptidase ImmA (M78 family)
MPAAACVKPELIQWAAERSRLPRERLVGWLPGLAAWESGEKLPTLKQLESFARRTMTPLGYLFLDSPPDEQLPVPDFRTQADAPLGRPSPNLIETVHAAQRRQAWMREYLIEEGHEPLRLVGSANIKGSPNLLAERLRRELGLDAQWATRHSTWEDALRGLRDAAEAAGILVASSAVVGLNNHRPLDPEEFRGFVLCDAYAPFVFINGADSKSAQMFTLAHELVHVWIGKGAVFNLIGTKPHDDAIERFCNEAAAEFLIPVEELKARWDDVRSSERPFHKLARRFKVSPAAAARRAADLGLIEWERFFGFYRKEQESWARRKDEQKKSRKGGPNFYTVQDTRLGRRFANAVVSAVRSGQLSYCDAYELTDLKGDTFSRYSGQIINRMKHASG